MTTVRRAFVALSALGLLLSLGVTQPAGAQAIDPGFVSGPTGGGSNGSSDRPDEESMNLAFASGSLINTNGLVVGDVLVVDDGHTAQWVVTGSNLPPGLHGLQAHATGTCQAPFNTSGPRLDAVALPPLAIAQDRTGFNAFTTASPNLAELTGGDGFSLLLHDRPDNRANVPSRYVQTGSTATGPDAATKSTGDVGPALACAVTELQTPRSAPAKRAALTRMAKARRAGTVRATGPADLGRADLKASDGSVVGQVQLIPVSGGPGSVSIVATGMTPGVHGLQIHSTGRCVSPGFASAGSRIDGIDLPDVVADADGSARSLFSISLPGLAGLLGGDGSSIVVQAGPDNHGNIPDRYTATGSSTPGPDATTKATGDAGANQLCGRLRPVPFTERFIEAVYSILDQRAPSRGEVAKWTSFLRSHSRTDMTNAVRRSVEARGIVVDEAYLSVLAELPGASQRDYWVSQLARRGVDSSTIEASLYGSEVFYDEQSGGDRADFISGVFNYTLFRDPSRGETALWSAYLDQGGRRSAMAAELLSSTEGLTLQIADNYGYILGVDATADQIEAWLGYFRAGGSNETMVAFLIGGRDFYAAVSSPASLGLAAG